MFRILDGPQIMKTPQDTELPYVSNGRTVYKRKGLLNSSNKVIIRIRYTRPRMLCKCFTL
jgi:hypothetical protein